jgi:hypothetical protein
MLAYNEYYSRLDPIASDFLRMPTGAIAARQQLVTHEIWTRSEFFNDWAQTTSVTALARS